MCVFFDLFIIASSSGYSAGAIEAAAVIARHFVYVEELGAFIGEMTIPTVANITECVISGCFEVATIRTV